MAKDVIGLLGYSSFIAGGESFSVVPTEDVRRLLEAAEMASDVATYDQAKKELESGEDELIPWRYAKRLSGGENPIRVYRELREMTARDLARSAGISGAAISQLESGKTNPSAVTLHKIAGALGVDMEDLMD